MTRRLLGTRSARQEGEHAAEQYTYVNKGLELKVVGHLVVYSIRRDRVIRNIFHVSFPEAQGGIEHWCCDTLDCRMFLALDFVQLIEQLAVMSKNFSEIVEHVCHETLQSFPWDDGRVLRPQRLDIYLMK